MDSLTVAAVVAECRAQLRGAHVNKVFQPSADTLYLRLWTGSREKRLYFSCRSGRARFHLTARSFPHPFTPPRFCQLLRSRLSRLVDFEQVGGDRMVLIHGKARQGEAVKLLVDLRPQANLLLLAEDDRIIDVLKRGGQGPGPGERFIRPADLRQRSLLGQANLVPAACRDADVFRNWLLDEVAPLSPLAADDMAASVRSGEAPDVVLLRYLHDLEAGNWRPRIVKRRGKEVPALLPLYGLQPTVVAAYPSVGLALDALESGRGDNALKAELTKALARRLQRLRRRLNRIEQDFAGLEDVEDLQHAGNLLLANLHRLQRGMAEIEVEDYAQQPPKPRILRLDPRLSPQENVDQLFRKARKLKRGEQHYQRRLQETRTEIDWLEDMALALEETDDELELDLLRRELAAAGLCQGRQEPARRQQRTAPRQYLETTSPSGYALIWGRNPRENDRLRREVAAADDLWFHAHGLPGSHLILRRAGRRGQIPEEDILYAAALAAGYSRGRQDSRVEVMVARAADVKKPKGAPPGLVTVDAYRTVAVPPIRLDEKGTQQAGISRRETGKSRDD